MTIQTASISPLLHRTALLHPGWFLPIAAAMFVGAGAAAMAVPAYPNIGSWPIVGTMVTIAGYALLATWLRGLHQLAHLVRPSMPKGRLARLLPAANLALPLAMMTLLLAGLVNASPTVMQVLVLVATAALVLLLSSATGAIGAFWSDKPKASTPMLIGVFLLLFYWPIGAFVIRPQVLKMKELLDEQALSGA